MSQSSDANRLREAFFSAKLNASTAELRWIGRARKWASAIAPSEPEDELLRPSAKVSAHWSGRVPEKPGAKLQSNKAQGWQGACSRRFELC